MRRLYVPLRRAALDRLIALAQREQRTPQRQAAYLLERTIERADSAAVAAVPSSVEGGRTMRRSSGHARPGWQARGATAEGERPGGCSASSYPVALAVRKRGRTCTVAKLVALDGEPVLAIAHRHQHGVATAISLPLVVLSYAERAGARWLYLRRDTTGEMYRLPLADVRRLGWLGPGAGAEWYVCITDMQRCAWRPWEYAERVVVLDTEQRQQQQQASVAPQQQASDVQDVQMALWDRGAT